MAKRKSEALKKIEKDLKNYHMMKETMVLDEKYLNETPLQGINYEGIHINETPSNYSVVERLAIQREKRYDRWRHYRNKISVIDEALIFLTEQESQIIIWRYFEQKPWVEITDLAFLSDKQCRRIRNKALLKIQSHLLSESNDRFVTD